MTPNDKKAVKLGVLASAIFTVLLFFAQRITGFIWNLVLTVGGHLHQGYVDGIYRNAASDERNSLSSTVALTGLALFGGLAAMLFVLGLLIDSEDSLSPSGSRFILTRYLRWLRIIGVTLIMPLALVFPVILSISLGTATISASFNQRLTVLAPAISDTECKTYRARWASMRSRADYDALVSAMDHRAGELGVKLPPVSNP